jgi:peptidoglycan/LPS O-acetylase OafA/YrhL
MTPSPAAAQALRPLRLGSIEACRGVAATMVVVYHASGILGAPANFGVAPFGSLFQFGRSGVDFFFALSGFLIALLHWKDIGRPGRLAHYANRRLTRVYPTYWLVLVAVAPFDFLTHTLFDHYDRPLEIVKAIFLIPQNDTILDVTWSMRNELLFYALFALMILNRAVGLSVVAVWIGGLATCPFLGRWSANIWIHLITYPMNIEFLAGVAAGWAFRRATVPRPAALLALGAGAFVALWIAEDKMAFAHADTALFMLRCALYGAAAAAAIMGLSALELEGRLQMPRLLTVLGGASYLIYLIHVPALLAIGASERHLHLTRFAPAWVLASLYIAIVIAAAVVINRLIETPMLNAIRGRREPPAASIAVG